MVNSFDEKVLIDNALEEINILHSLLLTSKLKKLFRIAIPIHCYTNLKDAVFHYYRLYVADDMRDKLNHYFAISEHIHRAKTDLFSSQYLAMVYCLENIINELKVNIAQKNLIISLRKVLHSIKAQLFSMRFNGMSMIPGNGEVSYQDYESCCANFINVIYDNDLIYLFRKHLESYS